MENKKPLGRLTAKTIYERVVKGNKTLQQIAQEYDCSFEQFVREAKKRVGSKEWNRVEKADKRNGQSKKHEATVNPIKAKKKDVRKQGTKVKKGGAEKTEKRVLQKAVECHPNYNEEEVLFRIAFLEEMLGVARVVGEYAREDATFAEADLLQQQKVYQASTARMFTAKRKANGAVKQEQRFLRRKARYEECGIPFEEAEDAPVYLTIREGAVAWARKTRAEEEANFIPFYNALARKSRTQNAAKSASKKEQALANEIRMLKASLAAAQ